MKAKPEHSSAHLPTVQVTLTVKFEKAYEQECEGPGRTATCRASVCV